MKLLAISDLHVGHAANRDVVRQMDGADDEWLLVAGDVAERLDDVVWVLATLKERFGEVVWAPGNHELWSIGEGLDGRLRGLERYEELIRLVKELGVRTPECDFLSFQYGNERLTVAPLFLLYDFSFRDPGVTVDAAKKRAEELGAVCSDEFLLKSDPFLSVAEWCAHLVARSELRLMQLQSTPTILVSHFPLRRDLIRFGRIPQEFELWCGTEKTRDWHKRFNSRVVVSGHLHIRSCQWIDGVRFEEVSMGYPREWQPRGAPFGPRLLLDTEGLATPWPTGPVRS